MTRTWRWNQMESHDCHQTINDLSPCMDTYRTYVYRTPTKQNHSWKHDPRRPSTIDEPKPRLLCPVEVACHASKIRIRADRSKISCTAPSMMRNRVYVTIELDLYNHACLAQLTTSIRGSKHCFTPIQAFRLFVPPKSSLLDSWIWIKIQVYQWLSINRIPTPLVDKNDYAPIDVDTEFWLNWIHRRIPQIHV